MQVLIPYYVLLCFIMYLMYVKYNKITSLLSFFLALLFFTFYVFFISTRSFEHPGDTKTYLYVYNYIINNQLSDFSSFRLERGFLYLTMILSKISHSEKFYLYSIAIINTVLWLFCFKRWFKWDKLALVSITFVSLFFSYNLGANVIRQGIAIPLAFISLKYLIDKEYIKGFIFIFIAILFHKSCLLFLVCYFLSKNKIAIKYYFYSFLLLSILSLFGLLSNVVYFFQSDLSSYQHILSETSKNNYLTGFRFDFWTYSSVILLLYYFIKDELKCKFDNIIKIYVVFMCIFVVMFDVPYSDRVGVFCWSFYPIILVKFIGNYKYSIFNNTSNYILLISLIGLVSFIFYPVMNLGWFLTDVF